MNFINGKVISDSSATYFVFGNQRIKLPGFMMAAASKYNGREVILGVRPEGLCPGQTNDSKYQWESNSFDAKVNVLEPLGDRVDLALSIDVHDHLICRADSHQFGKLPVGGIIKVFMDLGRVHLFEPGDNGVNITLTRETSHAAA